MLSRIGIAAFLCLAIAPRPSHAIFGLEKLPFFKKKSTSTRTAHPPLPNQKVQSFKLQKANVDDIMPSLEKYLDGIKSNGFLGKDSAGNAIIVTDDPDNLGRIQLLIREMDVVYDNSNPVARQMLAGQRMMKAIRSMGTGRPVAPPMVAATPITGVPPASGVAPVSSVPGAPGGMITTPPPASVAGLPVVAMPSTTSESEGPMYRYMDERPTLGAFEVIGWVRDSQGFIIYLKNQGHRYIFRHGKLLYNSLASKDFVPGINGIVEGQKLVLSDQMQGRISLNMIKTHEQERVLR